MVAFGGLSFVDGVWIHLVKLKLHTRPDSYREHLWHTARALLFPPTLVLLFMYPTAGWLLWLGVALVGLDGVAGVADVLSERGSRKSLGGLSSFEYLVHVLLVILHTSATVLVLASRPSEAWSLSSPLLVGTSQTSISWMVSQLLPGSVVIGLLHVWLAWRYRTVLEQKLITS
jgi:hypothetical protein